MIQKLFFLRAALILSLASFLIAPVSAQNKVVVIPLIEEAPPLEPFAPLAAESPPASAYNDFWGTHVIDKVTGLIWQRSDDNNKRNWYDAWNYCQDLELPQGVWTDWRLPSGAELMSIVYYGSVNPAINAVFWGTENSYYWSASTYAYVSGSAWIVNFFDGHLASVPKSTTYYVRCVRGLPARDSVFKDNGNGTVTDLATGLTWQQQDDNIPRANNGPAAAYCQGLGLAGGGWRLPTIKELRSIADDRLYGPAIDTFAFPNSSLPYYYWSATTAGFDSDYAASVYFLTSGVLYDSKSSAHYIRCVRGGQ